MQISCLGVIVREDIKLAGVREKDVKDGIRWRQVTGWRLRGRKSLLSSTYSVFLMSLVIKTSVNFRANVFVSISLLIVVLQLMDNFIIIYTFCSK